MSKRVIFQAAAWEEYQRWQNQDRKTIKRINQLLKDIERNENEGIGKPEPLKHKPGYWSRRIDDTNRLVYRIVNDSIEIAQCRFHYDD
ncbi:Txe/YoeB family addiction module toxin [Treponema primitia]|uniref:Txe/YoeB family addiction module toxin n=1 Tax=Treponema primitia TaxID=88058 RepID=UPI003980B408